MTLQTPEIRSGLLQAFDSGTYLATVQFTTSLQTFVTNVPTSRGIASAAMVVGRKVSVAFLDPANHADAVLFAVWT